MHPNLVGSPGFDGDFQQRKALFGPIGLGGWSRRCLWRLHRRGLGSSGAHLDQGDSSHAVGIVFRHHFHTALAAFIFA